MTEHFTLEELTNSSTAQRLGINNTPPIGMVANLQVLAWGLEKIRALLGHPMHIDSGYRCPALNKAVGSKVSSAHVTGFAADFTCADYGTPLEIVKAIVDADIKFDQLIQEGTWVHVSFATAMRQEVLTAHFSQAGTTYTRGA